MAGNKISTALFQNAIIFLNDAIKHFNNNIQSYDGRMLTVVEVQMAIELAIKYRITEEYGSSTIFENVPSDIEDTELEKLFAENKLSTREFENLKNFLKSKEEFSRILSNEFKYMEKFQLYRNKLVHLNYNFSKAELNQLEDDIIHVIVYVLHILLSGKVSDKEYREFLSEYIEHSEYERLLSNSAFYKSLQDVLNKEYPKMYFCPICSRTLVTPHKRCVGCLVDLNFTGAYGFVSCGFCGEDMVVYDACNIDSNREMRALCLNCKNDTIVYKCKKCGSVVNLELFDDTKCHPSYCEFDDE